MSASDPPDGDPLSGDALAQAELVRRGRVSAAELVAAAISRIEQRDPQLNAVVTRLFPSARRQVATGTGTGPFAGVPILVKDFGCTTADDPYTAGNRLLKERGYRAETDAELARRLRGAGFVILGRTNTAEFGQLGTTEPLAHGPTRNPWDRTRSPGGSSGGSGAAVAAGMVALAHGNDGLGSLRIPASACGLVALKPSRGRISSAPAPESLGGFATEGMLTRTVRDSAAVLDVIAGGDGPYRPADPPGSYLDLLDAPPRRLRVGVAPAPAGAACDPACLTAVTDTAAALARLGHQVDDAEPAALADPRLPELVAVRGAASVAAQLDDVSRRLADQVTAADVEPVTWQRAEHGRSLSAAQLAGALAELQLLARQILSWWDSHDLLLCPTMTDPPPLLGEIGQQPRDPTVTLTVPANITGQPAISVPSTPTAGGLPVGVQLVAAPGREHVLLAVAAQLERVQPWSHRRPAQAGLAG